MTEDSKEVIVRYILHIKALCICLLFMLLILSAYGFATVTNAQTTPDCSQSIHVAEGRIVQSECEALVALYNSTGGGVTWGNVEDNWLVINGSSDFPGAPAIDVCDWWGVDCGASGVEWLRLAGKNLSGPLPPELGDLSNLMHLDLADTAIDVLPSTIGNLSNLVELDLSKNKLNTVPPEFGALSNVTKINLSENQLDFLPAEIGNASLLV